MHSYLFKEKEEEKKSKQREREKRKSYMITKNNLFAFNITVT